MTALRTRSHSMRSCFLFLVLILAVHSGVVGQQNDLRIQEVMANVNLDSLVMVVRELSGDTTVLVRDTLVTIDLRYPNTLGHERASSYLEQKLRSFGLEPKTQLFSLTGVNVFAEQPGTIQSGTKIIIGAHYDDVGRGPGADDNASGTATVLEAARVLSHYRFRSSLIYVLWDMEESGLVGSRAYAQMHLDNADTLGGVINIDMIGWDGDGDSKTDIHASDTANSVQLADTLLYLNSLYGLQLNPVVYNPGTTASDHAAFWPRGYGAICFSEAYYGGDFNPHYHGRGDSVQYFNGSFFHRCAQTAIAGAATMAGILEPVVSVPVVAARPVLFALEQNWPNPWNPSTTIGYTVGGIGDQGSGTRNVKLTIYNVLGQEVAVLVNEKQAPGRYTVRFDGSRLASGVYLYRLQAGSFVETKRMVLLR